MREVLRERGGRVSTGVHLLYSMLTASAMVLGWYSFDKSVGGRTEGEELIWWRFVSVCFVAMALVLGMAYLQEAVTSALKMVEVQSVAG
jgi:hypothetical protein